MSKFGININGKTTDNKLVVGSVFKCYSTDGIPLDVIFEALKYKNYMPDWINIVEEAVESGMKADRVISMLDQAIVDSYGAEIRDVVINKLKEKYK